MIALDCPKIAIFCATFVAGAEHAMQYDIDNTTFSAEADTQDRRGNSRYLARAKAIILRDTDAMRVGLKAQAHDVCVSGLGLVMKDSPPDLDEVVKVQLVNEVQRFDREVRGCVRHITKDDNGNYRVGIELLTRLTPLEVSLLRLTCTTGLGENTSEWV